MPATTTAPAAIAPLDGTKNVSPRLPPIMPRFTASESHPLNRLSIAPIALMGAMPR